MLKNSLINLNFGCSAAYFKSPYAQESLCLFIKEHFSSPHVITLIKNKRYSSTWTTLLLSISEKVLALNAGSVHTNLYLNHLTSNVIIDRPSTDTTHDH